MYRADQPFTSSVYSWRPAGGGGSQSPLRSPRLGGRSAGVDARRRRDKDSVSGALDDGGYTAWVLAGRLSDSPRSSSASCGGAAAEWRTYMCSGPTASPPTDAVRSLSSPVLDVEHQRRIRHSPPAAVSRTDLIVGPGRRDFVTAPSSVPAARFADQFGSQRSVDAMTQSYHTAARPHWNDAEHRRQPGRSSPETLVNGLRQNNADVCAASRPAIPRYSDIPRYDSGQLSTSGQRAANGGSDVVPRDGVCQVRVGARCSGSRGVPESHSSTALTSPARSSLGGPLVGSSRLDVAAVSPPQLEAHALSLSCTSLPPAHRTASTSSSSSSSSTPPNVIRRHLKTIARLAALGGARAATSRHDEPGTSSVQRKLALTRSNSEPEAVDRVAAASGVPRASSGDDEYGFSCSCPSYRVRALLDQRDHEPPSATGFVGRSRPANGRSGAADDVRPAKSSTSKSTSSRLTPTPASDRRTSSSLMFLHDHTLPKVRCGRCILSTLTGEFRRIITKTVTRTARDRQIVPRLNRKSYAFCRVVTLPMTLSHP